MKGFGSNSSMMETAENYFQVWVINGGILMVVLVPCFFWMIGAMFQAMIRLRPSRVLPEYLGEKAREAHNVNDRLAFARDLESQSSPLAEALKLTLKQLDLRASHRPHRNHLENLTNETVPFVADDMYDALNIFATLYTVGPLLGLLGTILGMVKAFLVFGSASEQDLAQLSDGIQEALITTFWGLVIAIPAYVAAQSFQSRIRRYERVLLPKAVMGIIGSLYEKEHVAEAPDGETRP